MSHAETTCWTMIRGAAEGRDDDRRAFARRYLGVVRAYLAARWRGDPLMGDLDDATQEVFVEAFRAGGALDRVDARRPGGFRPFFYGVVRNVARRHEAHRPGAPATRATDVSEAADERLSRVFDRAWARGIMREAAQHQLERAHERGEDARQRVELLRLRFHEGLPIRRIAALWGADPQHVHREYAKARAEFRAGLRDVVAFHHGGDAAAVEEECRLLLASLG